MHDQFRDMKPNPVHKHFAIVAPPTLGHLNPLMALAGALQRARHRTTFVHIADAARMIPTTTFGFEPLYRSSGSDASLDAYLDILAHADRPSGRRRMIAATAGMSDILLATLPAALERIDADVVIADSAEPAGSLVAKALRLPFVTAITGLPLLRDAMIPPPFVGWRYREGPLGRARNAGGYAVADLLMRPITRTLKRHAGRWGLTYDASTPYSPLLQVAQCPAKLDFPRGFLPPAFRYGAPWRLPEESETLVLPDDHPLVFCSLGSLQGARKQLFGTMTAACAAIGARAVVAHGGGLTDAEAASLPGNPIVSPYWPQRALLRRCAAAILHGGFNSVLDALSAGTPIVTVPIAFEQPATAARLERAGAGRTVRFTQAGSRLTDALRQVVADPDYRSSAERLGADMTFDGATYAATLIDASLSKEIGDRPQGASPAA